MTTKAPIKLAELEAPIESIELPGGRTVEVLPLDSAAAQLAATMPETGPELVPAYWGVVKRCIPSITEEELQRLTVRQLDFIVTLASRQQQLVEAYLGNAKAPEATAPEASA